MGARKTKEDIKNMNEEERLKYYQTLEKSRAPKLAYFVYSVNEDHSLNVALITRSAEEALDAVDDDNNLTCHRFRIK